VQVGKYADVQMCRCVGGKVTEKLAAPACRRSALAQRQAGILGARKGM